MFTLPPIRGFVKAGPRKNQHRGAWMFPLVASDRTSGLIEIETKLTNAQNAGLNAIFVYTFSGYIDSVLSGSWDSLPDIIASATSKSIDVYVDYAPTIDKSTPWAIELRDHPEWAEVDDAGVTSSVSVCFVRPEVRTFEVNFIKQMADNYPSLKGFQLEEPGTYAGTTYCFCAKCRQQLNAEYSLNWPPITQTVLNALGNIYETASIDYVSQMHSHLSASHSYMKLSANGATGNYVEWDRMRGRAWHDWAMMGLIQAYSPQNYEEDPVKWKITASNTTPLLGQCAQWCGIGLPYITPDQARLEVIAGQDLGLAGFNLFRLEFLTASNITAIASTL
jgi:hypothetical protein